LGDAHRLAAVGDRVAEDQDARLPGLAREDRRRQRRAGIDAACRGMVLVEHDVEAELVCDAVLVEIAVVELGAALGIEQRVRYRDAGVLELFERRNVRIGHLGEVPGAHAFSSGPDLIPRISAARRETPAAARYAAGVPPVGSWRAARPGS